MFKFHNHCRACGLGKPEPSTLKESCAAGPIEQHNQLVPVMDLGLQPLANNFCSATEEHAGYAPLKVMLCPRCGLGQLSVVVNQKDLYSHYFYVTSQSQTMRNHFNVLIDDIKMACGTGSVVEIGSNDGTLLFQMKDAGFGPVLGIDPAENLVKKANQNNIPTLCAFFDEETGRSVATNYGKPNVIIARHVFCHIDDWSSVIKGLSALSAPETLIFIEVPYVMDMLDQGEWDTIYHEHLSYLSTSSLQYALKNSNLHIQSVKHYPIHGGAIGVFIRHNEWPKPPESSVQEYLSRETYNNVDNWIKFAQQSEVKAIQLSGLVRNLRSEGKTVVGYGASAKSTVWINACGFTKKDISWVCDSTTMKQYKLCPGTNIPIVDEGALTRDLPDYAICFAWNFLPEIVAKEEIFKNKGGKWITPTPYVQIL